MIMRLLLWQHSEDDAVRKEECVNVEQHVSIYMRTMHIWASWAHELLVGVHVDPNGEGQLFGAHLHNFFEPIFQHYKRTIGVLSSSLSIGILF